MDFTGKTTGEISNELNKDTSTYNSLEIARAAKDSIEAQLSEAIERGLRDFEDEEFSVVMVQKTDPRLHNVLKRIFYPTPFLPKPMPDQAVWVYNRLSDKITFMWSLPDPYSCAFLSGLMYVNPKFERSAKWCRLFFDDKLIKVRREETKVELLTEKEFLKLHREELTKMVGNDV